jgi:UPF0755 protein
VGGAGWFAWHRYTAPGPLAQPVNVVIPRGAHVEQIAALLTERGVLDSPLYFRVGALFDRQGALLKAGEFAFAAHISPQDAAAVIASGKTVVRRVTLAEGITVTQALGVLRGAEGMEGDIATEPAEGALLPDTYFYSWGDSRDRVLARQRRAMTELLNELWQKRAANLPLKTPQEALVLASIVEKETGVAEERPKVAAVFINRLKRGMRLQADPTTIYGITQGKAPLDRPLSRADLEAHTAWNTYVIDGLPPTPIALAGRAAIAAVLNPPASDDLYFVADGSGRHVFASTLAEHNRNVARLRQLERDRSGTR